MTGNKYGARKITIDGVTFDSLAEGRRYQELKMLQQAGEIEHLTCHPVWDLIVRDHKIGRYTADFSYYEKTGSSVTVVVEDVKGILTRDYVLRKKLMLAIYGIDIREVTK